SDSSTAMRSPRLDIKETGVDPASPAETASVVASAFPDTALISQKRRTRDRFGGAPDAVDEGPGALSDHSHAYSRGGKPDVRQDQGALGARHLVGGRFHGHARQPRCFDGAAHDPPRPACL